MAKKRYYDKKMSKMEGEMMSKASRGNAMMPQDVIMKYYPKSGYYLPEGINDGMSGIDKQTKADVMETKKELSPTKY